MKTTEDTKPTEKKFSRKSLARKRVVLPAAVLAGGLVMGSGAVAVGALDGNQELTGDALDNASTAAIDEVGEGKVVSAEVSDDQGVAYELEVRKNDGSEVDVDLDENNSVVRTEADGDDNDDDADDADDADDDSDDDDRPLTDEERSSIEEAALAEAGEGTVTDAETTDDRGAVFEAEVRLENGSELDVWLDGDFAVVDTQEDQDD